MCAKDCRITSTSWAYSDAGPGFVCPVHVGVAAGPVGAAAAIGAAATLVGNMSQATN